MTDVVKKIVFRGLEKKEEILFKSFLNLVKNDLNYTVELIQDPDCLLDDADILIADAEYKLSEDESTMPPLPTLKIGGDIDLVAADYLVRPVQWSDFRQGLLSLGDNGSGSEPVGAEDANKSNERLLPTDLALEMGEAGVDTDIDDIDQDEEVSRSFSDASDYNFELDKMSVDYHSFTNSEYVKAAADDVKGFQEANSEPEAVMLVSDDESSSSNSVLIIETNSLDAWDMEDSEFDDLHSHSVESPSELEMPDLSAKERKAVQGKLATGATVESLSELWMSEQEVMMGPQTLFIVRPGERKVYSSREPARWILGMRNRELTSVPLAKNWKPSSELKAYPLERLIWVNTLVGRSEKLDDGLSDNQELMLMKWPHFELLELDNSLLKMTTMLFVGPESAYSLMQKTGLGRAVVYGMLNACKELDLLATEEQIKNLSAQKVEQESGVFGKLKDAFR